MASTIKVDKLDPQSGTALEIGTSGDTVTVPSGVGLTLTDSTLLLPTTITSTTEVKTNKISPATGTAFALGDSGDTFTVPSGATIVNSGTATGFGGGKLLQVLQVTLTSTFSTTSTSFTDLTGLTVDITPAATSSKILVIVQISSATNSPTSVTNFFSLVRDSTEIFIGDTASSRPRVTTGGSGDTNRSIDCTPITYLDSPSATSATTYKIQMRLSESTNTGYINRTSTDGDDASYPRGTSSITVMEIGA
jgi:hypothetical protein